MKPRSNLLSILQHAVGFYCLIIILQILACKKSQSNGDGSDVNISDMKNWYNSEIAKVTNKSERLIGLNPIWDKITTLDDNENLVFEVDLVNQNHLFTADRKIDASKYKDYELRNLFKLIFIKNKATGRINGAYMNIVPDSNSLNQQKVHYKNVGNFTGKIQYYNINGTYNLGWHYTNGNIDKKFIARLKSASGAFTEKEPACGVFPVMGTICAGGDDDPVVCTTSVVGTTEIDCYPIEGGGSTGGGNTGGSGNNGGMDPGGSGSGSTNDPSTLDTVNHVTNICLKQGLAKAMQKDVVNDVKGLMASTYLGANKPDIDFYDSPMSSADSNTYAVTRVSNLASLNISITFNTSNLPNASEQFIVSTVYHEVLHAYLTALFPPNSPNGTIIIPEDHQYMATNYINMMTSSLRSMYPDITEADARALSWGGLENTSAYDLLTISEKNEIATINKKYSGKAPTNRLGKFCN